MGKVHYETLQGPAETTEFLNRIKNITNLSMNVLSITENPNGIFTVFYIDPRD